ncbi:MAG: GYF domain-containing protein [Saprospiraceae bacterium]
MPDYFYLRDGEKQGPYTLDYIRSLNLPPETPVLRGDTNEWIKSKDFGGVITGHERHLVGGDELPRQDLSGWFATYLGLLIFQSLFWSVLSFLPFDRDISLTQLISSLVYLTANIILLVIAIQWPNARYKSLMVAFAVLVLLFNIGSMLAFQFSGNGIF